MSNARTTTYTPDLLNRYTSRQVAGAVDVRGEATTDAAVTISTTTQGTPQGTTRTGKDFYKELSYTNTAGAVSDTATITATRSGPPVQTGIEQRPLFLPQTPESFSYDDDGNLTDDGRWTYAWDAENRLIGLETKVSIATAFPGLKQKLTFAYDAQGRRIRKLVETWNTALNSGAGGWATVSDTRFLYGGWNLLTELDTLNSNTLVRSYAWGLDLSGSLQGAGGVGGLLWANTPTHTFAASADGNGNIVPWVNTANLAFAGRADYGAFGESAMQTGVAKKLPFGFSSKYTDTETGLVYYGYRVYQPSSGQWLSRDPIEEKGGVNLHGMVNNDTVNMVDALGLYSWDDNCSLSQENRAKVDLELREIRDAVFDYVASASTPLPKAIPGLPQTIGEAMSKPVTLEMAGDLYDILGKGGLPIIASAKMKKEGKAYPWSRFIWINEDADVVYWTPLITHEMIHHLGEIGHKGGFPINDGADNPETWQAFAAFILSLPGRYHSFYQPPPWQ